MAVVLFLQSQSVSVWSSYCCFWLLLSEFRAPYWFILKVFWILFFSDIHFTSLQLSMIEATKLFVTIEHTPPESSTTVTWVCPIITFMFFERFHLRDRLRSLRLNCILISCNWGYISRCTFLYYSLFFRQFCGLFYILYVSACSSLFRILAHFCKMIHYATVDAFFPRAMQVCLWLGCHACPQLRKWFDWFAS